MNYPPVVCKYSRVAGQWIAWFDGSPNTTYGADVPMRAVCRLLEGADACAITLHVDQDQVGTGVLTCEALWAPPELLFVCSRCNGTGEYIGLMDVEACQPCGGRGWLVG